MTLPVLNDAEERRTLFSAPHLSYSRLAKYQTCPEQYRLYYLERLRPRFPSASLVFGQVLHQALSEYLAKVGWTAEAIASGRYYKRPGFWCSWCDFLPVCLGNKGKVKATLVQGE